MRQSMNVQEMPGKERLKASLRVQDRCVALAGGPVKSSDRPVAGKVEVMVSSSSSSKDSEGGEEEVLVELSQEGSKDSSVKVSMGDMGMSQQLGPARI
jgi:hypothetical protein